MRRAPIWILLAGMLGGPVAAQEDRAAIERAVDDIAHGRALRDARRTLQESKDRRAVVAALKAALEKDGSVAGKTGLLQTLAAFEETGAVRQALDSKVVSTRRAAAWVMAADPTVREAAVPVVLSWLRDAQADARFRAVVLCRKERLNIAEAVPDLMALLDREVETDADRELARQAMLALAGLRVEGLAQKLLEFARDGSRHAHLRGEALGVLGKLPDAPRDEVRPLLLATLRDKSAGTFLRSSAAGVLRGPAFATEEAWKVLEEVLLDTSDTDSITQRSCLMVLGRTAPLDRLPRILLDRRVYRHRYFGIRVDVATALSALDVRERRTLEIMGEYLVDEDPQDKQHLVRQEAWLTLFTLTGHAFGVRETVLFTKPPPPIARAEDRRAFLLRPSFMRSGVGPMQVQALKRVVGDLDAMRAIREEYAGITDACVAKWRAGAGD